MREGLWLNDKNAVIGMSRLNPLPKNSSVNRSLAKKPATAKAVLGVAAATPKPFKPTPSSVYAGKYTTNRPTGKFPVQPHGQPPAR